MTEPDARPLIDWLLAKYPDTPRTRAKNWILSGRVTLEGLTVRRPQEMIADPGDKLKLSDRHSVSVRCDTGWQIHPRLSVLHLDSSVAVVNKGAGLISVPAPDAEISALSILQDFITGKLRSRESLRSGKTLPAAYRKIQLFPVHRLDQYTTGVFCMACTPAARSHLIEQLKAHTLRREYIAFVQGRPSESKGTWRHWLALSDDQMRQRVVREPGTKASSENVQEAVTHYELMDVYCLVNRDLVVSKLRLRLETGRKHQIRVQAATVGLPLIGDRKYHPEYHAHASTPAPIEFARQALHAESISLEHPAQPGKQMTWTAPLPKDINQLESWLKQRRSQLAPSARLAGGMSQPADKPNEDR